MTTQKILDVLDFIEENDVKFIRLQFCDLYGRSRNISVSFSEFEKAVDEGLMFRSSSVPGYNISGDTELILYPDPETIMSLPWRPQDGSVARVICEIRRPDGSFFEGDSRHILVNTLKKAREIGLTFEVGAKIEFYLFEMDDDEPTLKPVDEAGFFDLAPLDKGENTRREIILTLEEMGFHITSSHHDVGKGQHEIDFSMSDPLTCADNIQTFKTVVKTVAERNGLHASFMPKPLTEEPGSGMHIMITAFKDGENIFTLENGNVSEEARNFAGGINLELAAIFAFSNPIINSYKRIIGGFGAPYNLKWKPEKDNAVIRIPNRPGKINHLIIRNPDAAANPYLLLSLLISAGVKGIEEKINPDDFMTDLPTTLDNALDYTENSNFIAEILGKKLRDYYVEQKRKECRDYLSTVHDWEIKNYFKTV